MRRRLAACLAVACALAVVAVPAGAVHETGSSFAVSLHVDGSADVVLTERYDLANASQRTAFERLERNESARTERRDAFRERLVAGARLGENRTNRTMSIGDAAIEVRRSENGTGKVVLRATWAGLAAVETRPGAVDSVSLSEPFASGFAVDRTLVVHGPDGFVRAGSTPAPAVARRNSAMWGAGEELSGFRARFDGDVDGDSGGGATATATPEPTPADPEGVGRFVTAVLLALFPALAVAAAIRRAA